MRFCLKFGKFCHIGLTNGNFSLAIAFKMKRVGGEGLNWEIRDTSILGKIL